MSNGAATLPHPTAASNRWADLTPSIRARLAGYGIRTLSDWRRLSASRRSGLFGITREMRLRLNSIARGAP
jgi:hypothetical protein